MFKAMFKALKRVFDNTLAPMLIGFLMIMIEWFIGAMSWLIITVADFALYILGGLLAAIPVPEGLVLTAQTFGEVFLDVAEVAGLWPAMGLYVAGLGVAFIVRVLTLGIGTR